MLAALGCHTDCVHILLEKGAKADAADKNGFTALHRAVSIFAVCLCVCMSYHLIKALNDVNVGFVPLQSPGCARCVVDSLCPLLAGRVGQ